MDFELNPEQQQLADAIRRWADKDYGFDARKAIIASEQGVSASAWQALAELGVPGLHLQATLSRRLPSDSGNAASGSNRPREACPIAPGNAAASSGTAAAGSPAPTNALPRLCFASTSSRWSGGSERSRSRTTSRQVATAAAAPVMSVIET